MSDKKNVPESYLKAFRPPLIEAMKLEGGTFEEAVDSLTAKGYFETPSRPWLIGFADRGMGRGDTAILDPYSNVVALIPGDPATARKAAELIVNAVNAQA